MKKRWLVGTGFALVAVAVILLGLSQNEATAWGVPEPFVCSKRARAGVGLFIVSCKSPDLICGISKQGISCVRL